MLVFMLVFCCAWDFTGERWKCRSFIHPRLEEGLNALVFQESLDRWLGLPTSFAAFFGAPLRRIPTFAFCVLAKVDVFCGAMFSRPGGLFPEIVFFFLLSPEKHFWGHFNSSAENALFFVLFVSLFSFFFLQFFFCPGAAVPCHRRAKALEGDYVGDTEVGQLVDSI